MRIPSNADVFEALCLQAADEGRGDVLFGESFERARKAARPFIPEGDYPSTYLEFPLTGDPFLDVTVLYNKIEPGMRIDSDAAKGTEPIIDWYARLDPEDDGVSFGFEVDTKNPLVPAAAIHFQPRRNLDLVRPFCEAAGAPAKADLYLDRESHMPEGWPLSFFGMFRGRLDSPLRICGYLDAMEVDKCAAEPGCVREAFEQVGFPAFDDDMLGQVSEVMGLAPGSVDFQFDVYPDGSLGHTFALDVQFDIKQPEVVRDEFESGDPARLMRRLQEWGIVDDRWKLAPDAAFARAIPVIMEDDSVGRLMFLIMPQWLKVRWCNGELQPSKLYYSAACKLA